MSYDIDAKVHKGLCESRSRHDHARQAPPRSFREANGSAKYVQCTGPTIDFGFGLMDRHNASLTGIQEFRLAVCCGVLAALGCSQLPPRVPAPKVNPQAAADQVLKPL